MDIHVQTTKTKSRSSVTISLELERNAIRIRTTQLGAYVTYADWQVSGPAYGPGLPSKTICIALPPETEASGIQVQVLEQVVLTETPVRLAPQSPPRSDIRPKPRVYAKPSIYRKEKIRTRPRVRLIETRRIGSIPVAVVELSPVSWTRKSSLVLATRLQIVLDLAPVAGQEADPGLLRREPLSDSWTLRDLQLAGTIVSNPKELTGEIWKKPPKLVWDYLLITDNQTWNAAGKTPTGPVQGDMVSAFTPLVDWRNQSGLKARLVTITDIVSGVYGDFSTGSADLQQVIRKFLTWAHDQWKISYVLLGGDQNIVPIRTLAIGWWTPLMPTDFYYSTLSQANDWEEGRNLDGQAIDFGIDVSIGRAPTTNAFEADAFVNKVIAYELLDESGGRPISSDYLRKVLFVADPLGGATDLQTEIKRTSKYPPDPNFYYNQGQSPFSLIALLEQLTILPETEAGRITQDQPGENRFCAAPGKDYFKICTTLTYKSIGSLSMITPAGETLLQYNPHASSTSPGWFLDLGYPNWVKVFGIPSGTAVLSFIARLTPEFRGPQNLLSTDGPGDYREIPYDHSAKASKHGWFYVKAPAQTEAGLVPADLNSLGLPVATSWVAVYDDPAYLKPGKFIFDPREIELAMNEQEAIRKQVAQEYPEWDMVSRLYGDVVDLPPADRYTPAVDYLTPERLRDKLEQGQHIVSLYGHGLPVGCCGTNLDMASALTNAGRFSIFYADSCLTNRYTEDSVSRRLVFNPNGGALAYIGFVDEVGIGQGQELQAALFRALAGTDDPTGRPLRLGVALDAARLAMQPAQTLTFNMGARNNPYTAIIAGLLGDPAQLVHRIPPVGFAAFYTNESVRLAQMGGYVNGTWNDPAPHAHMNPARHSTNKLLVSALEGKFRQQYDRQLGLGVDQAADFFANSVLRFIKAGIHFANSFQEPDQNSTDFNHHRTWAKNCLDPSGIAQGTVRAELMERVSDACDFILLDKHRTLSAVYTYESVSLGELGGFTGPLQAENSVDPGSYSAVGDYAWAREHLIEKYESMLAHLQSISHPSAFLAENFYADVCLRLIAYGVFDPATPLARDDYLNPAKYMSLADMGQRLAMKVRRLFIELYHPDEFPPRVEIRFLTPAGVETPGSSWVASVDLGHAVVGSFKIYNQGGGKIKISYEKFTGGFNFQNASFSIPDDEIAFGHPVTAEVQFQAGQAGICEGELLLYLIDPNASPIVIGLSVHVAAPSLRPIPASVDFGRIQVPLPGTVVWGGSAQERIFLLNSGNADAYYEVRSQLEDEIPYGQFQFLGTGTPGKIIPGSVDSFDVGYMATREGEASATLVVDYYPAGRWDLGQAIRIPLHGIGFIPIPPKPDIQLDLLALDYGLRAVNQEYLKSLTITNAGDADLVISALDIASPGATDYSATNFYFLYDPGTKPGIHYSPLPMTIAPGASRVVSVIFYPYKSGFTYSGTLTLRSNDLEQPEVIVPLSGWTAGPRISVSLDNKAEEIKFDTVGRGDPPRTIDVEIQSSGTTDLTVRDILFDPPCAAFSFSKLPSPFPKVMPPGTKAKFQIAFQSATPGQFSSRLKIYNDDPGRAVWSCLVKGACK